MHLRYSFILLTTFLFSGPFAFGQLRQILHTTIPGDSLLSLTVALQDDYSVHVWQNSAVFIESEIVLATCQEGIFNHVVEQGRYALKSSVKPPNLTINQAIPKRASLTSPKGPCDETIHHRIYIPSDFVQKDESHWSRTESLNKSTINEE